MVFTINIYIIEYWRWPDMEELKYAFNPRLMLEVFRTVHGNRLHSFLDGDLCVDFSKKKLNILDFPTKLIYACLILYF